MKINVYFDLSNENQRKSMKINVCFHLSMKIIEHETSMKINVDFIYQMKINVRSMNQTSLFSFINDQSRPDQTSMTRSRPVYFQPRP